MKRYCKNHPSEKAISFCHVCKNYYCLECLNETRDWYYCHDSKCYSEYISEQSKYFESYEYNPRFCPLCLEETSEETTGNISSINFIGEYLRKIGHSCKTCHSYVVEKEFIFLGIPVKTYGYYRIIELGEFGIWGNRTKEFYSRKLTNQNKYKY